MTPTNEESTWQNSVSCVVIREPDEIDQCILYPTHSSDEEIKEIYINAEGTGFVSLEDAQ